MQTQLHCIQAPNQIYLDRSQRRRGWIALLIYVVLEESAEGSGARIGKHMIDVAILLFGGFERGELLIPGCYVDFAEGDCGVLGFGEGVQVAGVDLCAVLEEAFDCCKTDAGRGA